MKAEIPVCEKCCCCLPLRYGLLAWGYFKMIAEALIIPLMVLYLLNILIMLAFNGEEKKKNWFLSQFVLSILTLTLLVTDIVATIVFIIGGHKKNVKLLRGLYFYNIAMLIVTILLIASAACMSIIFSDIHLDSFVIPLLVYSGYSVIIGLQIYFLLLLRSEVIKLRNSGEFRFVNNAAEAECTMLRE